MVRLLRFVGLLAPVALALYALLVPALADAARTAPAVLVVRDLLAALVGVGVCCLIVSLWAGFRLRSVVVAAERIAKGDMGVRAQERSGLEGRLAIALNELAQRLNETQDAASTDLLTGIANRQALLGELDAEIERAHRYTRPLAVAFVDIDHFKSVNDTYGHHAGDLVLRRVASVLSSNVRTTDLVGRYGGEEFMLLLPETGADEAAALAEKLRLLVMHERIAIETDQRIDVTISIGIAGGTGTQVRSDTIIRDADAAMYSAKNLGRNQTYLFAEPDEDARVPRAPVTAEGRASAMEIGRAARAAAEEVIHSVLEPLPHYRGRPSELIATIATTLARQLDLPPAEVERIRVASLLHDVGKVAVPASILEKPAPLTPTEWQSVVQHPRVGQLILEQASSLREAVPIILHHHERYGGSGYPHGLSGEDIPLGARIVAIADAYDAMTSDRPYKKAISHSDALEELTRNASTQFDPHLVALFCELFPVGIPDEFVRAAAYAAEARRRTTATWSATG